MFFYIIEVIEKSLKKRNLTNNKSIQKEIAAILRKIGSKKCLAKAEILESESSSTSSLHLRNLSLNSSNLHHIANCFNQADDHHNHFLKSISFSYNQMMGDSGAIVLMKNLPKSICEIGLVNCGISDIGGIEILQCMLNSPNLQMICMEQNNFSEKLKLEFNKFRTANPHILVVY